MDLVEQGKSRTGVGVFTAIDQPGPWRPAGRYPEPLGGYCKDCKFCDGPTPVGLGTCLKTAVKNPGMLDAWAGTGQTTAESYKPCFDAKYGAPTAAGEWPWWTGLVVFALGGTVAFLALFYLIAGIVWGTVRQFTG